MYPSEPAPTLEPAETFEPAQPPQPAAEPAPPVEPQPVSAPEEELPDWLQEPAAAIDAAIESRPKASTPTQPEAESTPVVSSRPALAAEAEEEFEPVRPYSPDLEEPESELELPPAFGLAAEPEDEDLPEWLREPEPTAVDTEEEEFEPVRPYYPDIEEPVSELELPLAFSPVVESDNGDFHEWLTEPEAAVIESEPEPIAQPEAERAPAVAAEPAPRPQPESVPAPSLTIAPPAPAIPEGDTVGQFFEALRNGKIDEAVALYGPGFSHVSPERVERGPAALREFYAVMLQHIESAGLVWMFLRRTRLAANVQWITMARDGRPFQGMDSFHLNRDGQIIYHRTSFQLGAE